MRVITGSARGRRLKTLEGESVRPTTDKVKESIFNIIQFDVEGSRVLDMFAGSGALSFEAVSRGANSAVLVDCDKNSVAVINKNIRALGFENVCKVLNMSCFDYVSTTANKFDIIFLDPPYNKGFIEPALSAISDGKLLAEDGIIVLESDDTDFKSEVSGLEVIKQKRYGRTFITIYKAKDTGIL